MTFDSKIAFYGSIVGFVVGLVGGGGSVLGVPILTYIVGVPSAHIAIGTSAVSVGVSALLNLVIHSRVGNVDWKIASAFSACGVVGVILGNQLGLVVEAKRLMLMFGLLMLVIASFMIYKAFFYVDKEVAHKGSVSSTDTHKIIWSGVIAGLLAGFFGIGGGVLVVPALIVATGMPAFTAIGSSLVAIVVFSLITIASYSYGSLVDWNLAASYTTGALAGTIFGSRLCSYLARFRLALSLILAAIIGLVGVSVVLKSWMY